MCHQWLPAPLISSTDIVRVTVLHNVLLLFTLPHYGLQYSIGASVAQSGYQFGVHVSVLPKFSLNEILNNPTLPTYNYC